MSNYRLGPSVALGAMLAVLGCREERRIQVYYEYGPYEYAVEPAAWGPAAGEYVPDEHAGVSYEEPPTYAAEPAEVEIGQPAEDTEYPGATIVLIDPNTRWDPNVALPDEPEPWETVGIDRYENAGPQDTVDTAVTLIEEYVASRGEVVIPTEEPAEPLDSQGEGMVLVNPVSPVTSTVVLDSPVIYQYYVWGPAPVWAPTCHLGWAPIWVPPYWLGPGRRLWPPYHSIGVYSLWTDDFLLGLPPAGWWNYRPGWDPPWVATGHYTYFPYYKSGTYFSVGFSGGFGASFGWGGSVWHGGGVSRQRRRRDDRRYDDRRYDEASYRRPDSPGRSAGGYVFNDRRPMQRPEADRRAVTPSPAWTGRRLDADRARSQIRPAEWDRAGSAARSDAPPARRATRTAGRAPAAPSSSPRASSIALDRLVRARQARMEEMRRTAPAARSPSGPAPVTGAPARDRSAGTRTVASPARSATTSRLVRPFEERMPTRASTSPRKEPAPAPALRYPSRTVEPAVRTPSADEGARPSA